MSTIATAVDADSRAVGFSTDLQGQVWTSMQESRGGSTWSAWSNLGGAGATQLVTATSGGLVSLFALAGGTAQLLGQTASGWGSWTSLGEQALSRLAVGVNIDGRLELFGLGAGDGAVWHTYQTTAGGSTWSGWSSLGLGVGGLQLTALTVVLSPINGRLYLFAVDTTGAVQVTRQRSDKQGWQAWTSLGGSQLVSLASTANQDGRLEVFALDRTGAAWHDFMRDSDIDKWSGWESLGGTGLGQLTASINDDGRLEIFALLAGTLVHAYQAAANVGPWSAWKSLSAPTGTSLTQQATTATAANGALTALTLAVGRALARIAQAPTSTGWSPWTAMGTLAGPGIDHVVVLMLENRGFDSVLGYLYRNGAPPSRFIPAGGPPFQGLDGLVLPTQTGRFRNVEVSASPHPAVRGPDSPGRDPGEPFHHVNVQLFGEADPPAGATPTMTGFLADYCQVLDGEGTTEVCKDILASFTPADLPVLSGLARTYAVSDAWFSSVPTQTNANRAFSLCGTSLGLVDNGWLSGDPIGDEFDLDRFDAPTIWNQLAAAGLSWKLVFNADYPPILPLYTKPYTWLAFPQLQALEGAADNLQRIEPFLADAREGRLPAFTYIEPAWGGLAWILAGYAYIDGNDYHPPQDVSHSEDMLRAIYDALRAHRPTWERTLFVVYFDEHGGTYDHVAPPATVAPWGPATGVTTEYDFGFDRLGVRVPCLLASPWIDEQTVVRSNTAIPFDHTSVLAGLLDWQGLDRSSVLGARVAAAPSFWHALTRTSPRTDDDAFPPAHGPDLGTRLQYGQPFLLKSSTSDVFFGDVALEPTGRYIPYLRATGMAHECRGGYGPVSSGDGVQLRTSSPGVQDPEIGGRPPAILGVWDGADHVEYRARSVMDDATPQIFEMTLTGVIGQAISFGDLVRIEHSFSPYRLWALTPDGDKVSLVEGSTHTWVITPLPSPPARGGR